MWRENPFPSIFKFANNNSIKSWLRCISNNASVCIWRWDLAFVLPIPWSLISWSVLCGLVPFLVRKVDSQRAPIFRVYTPVRIKQIHFRHFPAKKRVNINLYNWVVRFLELSGPDFPVLIIYIEGKSKLD